MATANPNLGAVRGYAGGGLISKLFGKSETVTEKFARQDAEFRAKHPERASAEPQAPAPGLGGIKGMISGSIKTNLQEREKAAGLKAGGMVKKCVTGGKITGPGGPTDDLVPIMASNGEFMIKASSAKVLGPKVLKALNDVGGKGVEREPGKMAGGGEVDQLAMSNRLMQQRNLQDATAQGLAAIPQDSQKTYAPEIGPSQIEMPQLKTGGMVRKMVVPHMAEAGSVDEARRRAEQLAQIPTGGRTAPAPDGLSNGNDFTRNVNTNLNALGGMSVVASVPLKAAQAGQGAIRSAMNAAPVLQNAVPRLAAPAVQAAQAAPDFIAGASGVAKVGGANLPAAVQGAGIPVAKATNVALQEGAKANQMAVGTRSLGNASAGAGMLDGQQAPLQPTTQSQPAAPSLNAPWYSPEYAKAANASDLNGLELERTRRAAGSQGDANDPLKNILLNGAVGESSASPTPATSPANAYNDPSRRLDVNYGAPAPTAPAPTAPAAAPVDEFSNAAISQRNPGGMVRKVVGADGRTTYSGSNISGDVSFQGADGNALPGRPGGGFMTYGGMSQEQIKSALTNPDGSAWTAGDNAIMAANIRDGVDKYRGTSRDPRNDPMNQPMTKDQRAARVKMAEIASRERQNAQTGAREQEQLGMTRTEHVAKMAREKQLADAQAEYLAAGDDPVKLKAAERKLMVLGGKQQAAVRAFAVPGGQGFNADGTPYTIASSVYDPDTKQFIQQGGPQGVQPAALPPKDKLVKGQTYPTPRGNAVWDGQQFTPV